MDEPETRSRPWPGDPYKDFYEGARVLFEAGDRWSAFERGLRDDNRAHPNDERYLAGLLDACLETVTIITRGRQFFRARIMPVAFKHVEGAYPPVIENVGPPMHDVPGGRLNPPGIRYLYLASDPQTAISEVRPWKDAWVTVATFKIGPDVQVVDLTSDWEKIGPGLAWLNIVLSRPPHREDRLAYVASQFVAEKLKARGLGGIMYQSSMGPIMGSNLALFDVGAADPVETHLYRVKGVTVDSTKWAAPADATPDGSNQ